MKCCECEFAKSFIMNRHGCGNSAGVNFSEEVKVCNHPNIQHTVQSLGFTGKTSPRNCPLRKTYGRLKFSKS